MKSILYILPLVAGLVLGLAIEEPEKCQCPLVKCPADDAVKLCQCLNSRETLCHKHCPDYVPLYIPCPTNPPTSLIPSATSKPSKPTPPPKPTGSCVCETVYCLQVWPQSCTCANAGKKACFEKCGGPKPEYQVCDALKPRLLTTTRPSLPTKTHKPRPSTTKTGAPFPTASHLICGGGRGNYMTCPEGQTCIKDPFKPGCGPECDGTGICVKDKMCGGFAGFACPEGQTCVDDARDDCDPLKGGADCGGLCI
ncbi:hypothetical protein BCR34DRAFT_595137 [Clohesyomyces aquaticus]|uniref:IGFBP N-terminal domain-containing protein n=1 Tax=Clohesyomyces aquaticus TaxID=1231657 RepID=A0A1Y2AAV3_9PLEO|nr:hypothetical protein BCR34DRAFT_595137 [Clohesyomyces aquaticus]